MKMDLKLLKTRFFQAAEGPPVSTDGVNPYLLEHILKPHLRGKPVRYGDIDYDAFENDDLYRFSEYCEELNAAGSRLDQFTGTLAAIEPEACKKRTFC